MNKANRMNRHSFRSGGIETLVLLAAFAFLDSALTFAAGEPKTSAERLIVGDSARPGLCVHADCGGGTATAALALGGKNLVQGLTADEKQVAPARAHVASQKLSGRVTIDYHPLTCLPYADNLVNTLFLDDFPALQKKGLSVKEALRVTQPKGVIFFGKADATLSKDLADAGIKNPQTAAVEGYARIVKPWPADMDEWQQHRHDTTRTAVSADKLVNPSTSLQWVAGNMWAHKPISQMVSANGRIFYYMPNDVEKLKEQPGFTIEARDAFNGLFLWRTTGEGNKKNCYSLITAAGDRVYTYLKADGPLVALDAATGKTVTTYPTGGTMVTVYKDILIFGQGVRDVHDAKTGQKLWTGPAGYDPCIIGDDQIFTATKDAIFCLDPKTGKTIWTTPFGDNPRGSGLFCYADGVLYCSGRDSGNVGRGLNSAYSAKDGKFLWSYTYPLPGHGGRPDIWPIGGLAWVHRGDPAKAGENEAFIGLDPKTGKESKTIDMPKLVKHRCYAYNGTVNYLLGGGMDFFDVAAGKVYSFHGGRGVCGFGYIPANGLVYTGPTLCECFAHIRGLTAFGSAPAPTAEELSAAKKSRFLKGTAAPQAGQPDKDDWPTFRRNPARAGSTEAPIPGSLAIKWEKKVGSRATAPVAAQGRIFAALPEDCGVVALDGKSGDILWQFTTSSPVNLPPTVSDGVVLFGCTDGWVYALSPGKGELIWRLRAAPLDRRIVGRERVESAWPVFGSVLAMNGTAYFAAGRHDETDGGIFLFAADIRTGQVVWEQRIVRETLLQQVGVRAVDNEMNDLLVSDGKTIFMYNKAFDAKTGARTKDASSNFLWGGTSGWLDDMTLPPYGWKHEMQRQRMIRTVGKRGSQNSIIVQAGSKSFNINVDRGEITQGGADGKKGGWSVKIPDGACPKSILHAQDTLVIAAAVGTSGKGEIWIHSAADGSQTSKTELPAVPAFDAIAAIPGFVFVSTQDGRIICLGK
ncbi:MAG: PQQ-binding-like beta-propeller repeat protein [Planctomycetes bacterium]|nr:PQQ-binding-like beta-propeller repeat protein [Planctomycetota bacterium]